MNNNDNIKLFATSTASGIGERISQQLKVKLCFTVVEKFSDGELFVKFDESVRGPVLGAQPERATVHVGRYISSRALPRGDQPIGFEGCKTCR